MKYAKRIRTRLSLLVRDRRGDIFVDTVVGLLVISILIVSFIQLTPLFIIKQSVDFMASQLVRTIELTGEVGSEYYSELSRLKTQTKLDPSISVSATYVADNKIQLRNRITLTVSTIVKIPIFTPAFTEPVTVDVPVSKTITGMSEVYWKAS